MVASYFIDVGWIIEMGIAVARVEVFVSLTKVFSDFSGKSKLFHQFALQSNEVIFSLFNFSTTEQGVGGWADFNWFRMAGSR